MSHELSVSVTLQQSMPASLLESILPGDVKESRFGNNDVFSSPPPSATNNEFVSLVYEEAESKLRPISLCNPLSEDPDVKGDAVREKSADLSEGSRVNEAEMIDPENLSPRPTVRKRANRVYKVVYTAIFRQKDRQTNIQLSVLQGLAVTVIFVAIGGSAEISSVASISRSFTASHDVRKPRRLFSGKRDGQQGKRRSGAGRN